MASTEGTPVGEAGGAFDSGFAVVTPGKDASQRALANGLAFGAHLEGTGVRFRLWAPDCQSVSLCIEGPDRQPELPLTVDREGWWEVFLEGAGPGTRYRYRIDGDLRVPDPASRFQPDDLHGASEIIDPLTFVWNCTDWRGRPWEEAVVYELHVGTFTPEGTYRGVIDRLDALVELGVTAIELMPVAQFPGAHDWGYNGALLFAPASQYGRPEDLKALIDAAHARGLMVMLDVVYNHFGPVGNYLYVYARRFFNADRHTPWGAAIDFEGPSSLWVREFFVQNAIYWLGEFRFDGLRFDAVHAIDDQSPRHFLEEMGQRVRQAIPDDRHVHLVLENDRNEARFLRPTADAPAPFVAQWNDDIHHVFHVLLTGESSGYYEDYADDPGFLLARCLTQGFAYQGDPSRHRGGERRGEPSGDLPPTAFVNFLQNHDQVGNRAFGERLGALTSTDALRAASAVLLLSPSTPLLFMGEEWAASEPFLFFCDLGEDLRDSVRDGRRREFAGFPAFKDPAVLATIPDPTDGSAFRASVLDWRAREQPAHAAMLEHYRRLLALRQREIAPRLRACRSPAAAVLWRQGKAVSLVWTFDTGEALFLRANLDASRQPGPSDAPRGRLLYACPPDQADATDLAPWSVRWWLSAPA
jgi:malto-oligosyltrehalose trehalohydrolase